MDQRGRGPARVHLPGSHRQDCPELLCSEYPNANRDKFLSRIRSLRPARALVLHRCKDGSRKVNMVALTPVRGKGGHAVGQLAIVREVAHGERADALAPGPREVHESGGGPE